MSYKIVCDSCTDLTESMQRNSDFVSVPLTISIDGKDYIDDDSLQQDTLLKTMAASNQPIRTACPSPAQYLSHMEEAEDVYVVTLSDRLSGSYGAATQAAHLHQEEGGKANVHVFNSRSASSGQVLIAMKIQELCKQCLPFEDIVSKVEAYISSMTTMFVLENLDNLRKNGRLTKVQSLVTGSLHIKLLMGSTPEGEIKKLGQGISEKSTLKKMIATAAADASHAGRRLVIAHCNCFERAEFVKGLAESMCHFGEIIITATKGISTVYANDGGIVIAY